MSFLLDSQDLHYLPPACWRSWVGIRAEKSVPLLGLSINISSPVPHPDCHSIGQIYGVGEES